MQLPRFDKHSYSFLRRKELFLVGLISVIVASSLGFGFFAILKSNQQVVAVLSAHSQQQHTQANPSIIATITKRQPILTDSLSQNTNKRWMESTHCVFQDGSYHILLSGVNQQDVCGMPVRTFSNVAIQVEMSLLSGEEAGLLFRVQSSGLKEYYYGLDHLHRIFFCVRDVLLKCPLPMLIIPCVSIGRTNVLLVLAQKNTMLLYVNGVFIYQLQDSTSSNGLIGFNAVTGASTQLQNGDASFSHLKVYQA
jgi:hypothetical protein